MNQPIQNYGYFLLCIAGTPVLLAIAAQIGVCAWVTYMENKQRIAQRLADHPLRRVA